jgi:hypothetical protein
MMKIVLASMYLKFQDLDPESKLFLIQTITIH